MKKFLLLYIISLLVFSFAGFSQTTEEKNVITKDYNIKKLDELAKSLKAKAELEKAEALKLAKQNGWPVRYEEDGKLIELMKVSKEGMPVYYTTFNIDAAKSTRANTLHNGGILGLNVEGQNMEAHFWDGGLARITHQEYDGTGGNNRFSIGDGTTALHYHSAHVTGTIIASGVMANAKGMAPQADAIGYDWYNDMSEATTAAGNGMLLSNHSYGWRASDIPDWYFGAYLSESRDWDNILYNAPYYLMVVAAGNDGDDDTSNGDPLDENSSYDKLSGHATSKNNLVVANAQDANIDANGNLISVNINTGSSEGPCDDYRIKPDIAGNGTALYSTDKDNDSDYLTISGTSMASPNVCGTLLLLQQHYNNLNSGFMRAATLKGLALHTADDAGPSGPDVVWGWGLLNGKEAANVITNNGDKSLISELTLNDGGSYSMNVVSDGINNLMVSISWTDPAGTANTGTVNDPTPALVNDLDIRVTQGVSTYYPYRLVNITTNGTGDNIVDPFEKVIVSDASGTYTITVTHKGNLSSGSQAYSMIISGLSDAVPPVADFSANNLYPVNSTNWVNFSDLSIHSPTSWLWTITPTTFNYVGSTSSTSQNPVVSFTQPGAYNVSLTATNSYGNDTEIKSEYIHVGQPGLWTGATSTAWNTTTNWENQLVPTSSTDVSIPATATNWPTYTSDFELGTQCLDLTMDGSSELTITGNFTIPSGRSFTCNGSNILYVGGDWTNTGTFTPGTGTVVFDGNSNAAIDATVISSNNLQTTFAGGNGSAGNMFDIVAINEVTITGFDGNLNVGTGNVHIYYKSGTYVGYESNSSAWTFVGTTSVTSSGNGSPTSLPIALNVTIPTGQTYAFYVHAENGNDYTNGSSVGNIYASDANIQIIEGCGKSIPLFTGSTYQPRVFNGIVYYNYSGGSGSVTYNNLVVVKSNAEVQNNTAITINGNLTIKPDAWFTNSTGKTISVGNDLTLEASSSGAASFIDEGTTTVTGNTNVQYYCVSDLWHFISSCFDPSGTTFNNLFTTPVPTALYRWDESLSDEGTIGWWIDIRNSAEWSSTTFVAAQGYAISDYTAKATTYTLSGVLYNTTKTLNMTKTTGSSGEGWNLVGNSFPCSMAANTNAHATNNFLTRNASVLDASFVAVYLYNDAIQDYVTINNGSSATYISNGQGFLVRTATDGNDISFHIDDRKHGTATFYKGGDETQRFFLTITSPDNVINETEIVFMKGMTKGLDPSYDAGKYKGNPELSLYTSLVESNNHDFAIQALPLLTEPVVVSVGFIAGYQGNYSFTAEMQNFELNTPVTLVDKYTSTQVDLSVNPQYSFVVGEPRTFNNRFLIYFKSAVGVQENDIATSNDFEIYAYGNQIFISSSLKIEDYSVSVYNAVGQLILQKDFNGVSFELINIEQPGTYIVRVVSEQGVTTKKVVVQ